MSGPDTAASRTPLSPGASFKAQKDGAWAFETPTDLLCPITCEIFRDPVINAAGQVYERDAIVQHLRHRTADPISNLPLQNMHLTPVYPMKSRAMEYRESAAKMCIEACCQMTCEEPMKYLRRAAELSCGVSLHVPGMSRGLVDAVSNTNTDTRLPDDKLLYCFAEELRLQGYPELAANVYAQLLKTGIENDRKVEVLRKCILCWTPDAEDDDGHLHANLIHKLAPLSSVLTPVALLDLVIEAGLGHSHVLALCEHILQTQCPTEQDKLQLKYLQVHCQELQQHASALEQKLAAVQAAVGPPTEDGEAAAGSPQSGAAGHSRASKLQQLCRPRVLMPALLAASAMVWGNGPVSRLLKVAPLVYMLRHKPQA
jgi:hypothetical protein